ncbi:MAG TPA: L-histidine N(alpha)-methyltransferase [Acidimicrobiales bacterium]|nr:L-histidine N(alpha)-methyltransferase [Acidimicrobiales bacterium]
MTFTVVRLLSPEERRKTLEADLRAGLGSTPRWLSPIWLYDECGSALYDEITRLPEYYPTRREQAIFDANADEIVRLAQCDTLVELGSGTSEKTHELLDAMVRAGSLRAFVGLDVSEEVLVASTKAIASEYDVDVTAVVADFHRHLDLLPLDGKRLIAFLGGTIGNFEREQRVEFLSDLARSMTTDDALLLGTDLVKDRKRLIAAYDDRAGVTAAFNLNVLSVINREFHADFDISKFIHVACFDDEHSWIEMRLRAVSDQTVRVADLDMTLRFIEGEEIRTEISTKFRNDVLDAELVAAGLSIDATFTDPGADFRVTLARRKG